MGLTDVCGNQRRLPTPWGTAIIQQYMVPVWVEKSLGGCMGDLFWYHASWGPVGQDGSRGGLPVGVVLPTEAVGV